MTSTCGARGEHRWTDVRVHPTPRAGLVCLNMHRRRVTQGAQGQEHRGALKSAGGCDPTLQHVHSPHGGVGRRGAARGTAHSGEDGGPPEVRGPCVAWGAWRAYVCGWSGRAADHAEGQRPVQPLVHADEERADEWDEP